MLATPDSIIDIGPCHHWETLENLQIRIKECKMLDRNVSKFKRLVSLGTSSDSFPVAAWVNVLMKTTYDLHLEWCFGLKNVLQLNPKGKFYNLKTLHIHFCPEMEYVVNVKEPETMFPQLETLNLLQMKILKAIWNFLLQFGLSSSPISIQELDVVEFFSHLSPNLAL
ncbi:hypothetical protein GIB67_013104 [Kingdonia uniflora]|uniref:Disease resistance protein At4g27190-like leucine-rich repeats domain-containing protein n=1 Tax=Kingdonia uniflora TaxID=39325 RepID=A0A7J7NP40_9MAGN|nr:hypothetical protein GIB67_013104 [Kingdonia uniflora]